MDKFALDTSGKDKRDITTMIKDACDEMVKDLKPVSISLKGNFNPDANLIEIEGKGFDNQEINNKVLNIFFDIFYYLPVDVRGKKYRFKLTTFLDIMMNKPKNTYLFETSMDKMPDTGNITKQDWDLFISQLTATKNGKPFRIPEPVPFWDEVPTEEPPKK
ncbi:MAG: hypothetical protein K8T10_05905 [Candidatus Eremiobacteraeota bacterium]|nr:hypothetical protein [Candidatus Eremiobacteraeota bacterium]